MNLATRIKTLEARQNSRPSGLAKKQLLESLQATYSKLGDIDANSAWLTGQSNATALAIALCGPRPLPQAVRTRMSEIAGMTSPVSTLAQALEELDHAPN